MIHTPIRVMIVDDQELVRHGFRLVIDADPRTTVVGEAGDGEEAVQVATRLNPDVVVMDVRMPGMNGIEATRRITVLLPHTRVLVLTTYDLDEYAFGALRAGASGFLVKSTRPADLIGAIASVHAGDAVVSPRITARLIEMAAPQLVDMSAGDRDSALAPLTPRERDVFDEIARGATNGEIASTLYLSESTVKAHVGRVLLKLGLRDRVHAVILAYQLGVAGR